MLAVCCWDARVVMVLALVLPVLLLLYGDAMLAPVRRCIGGWMDGEGGSGLSERGCVSVCV